MSGERVNDHIFGKTLTIRDIFSGRHFRLDSYQREYAWTEKQVEDLINDLTRRFSREWSPQHELKNVAKYQPYFLGPVITSRVEEFDYLIDGQQRLSTLILLLIWLRRIQDGREDAVEGIDSLIYSAHFGEKLFTVDDPERRQCLHALLRGTDFDVAGEQSVSVRNLWERFADIERLFPEDLRDEELPFFIYWLLDRVTLVEISTGDSGLALEIFETMNDRGLRLTSLDLLKSFILTQLDAEDRRSVNQVWRSRLTDLTEIDSNAHSAFVKSWLRAKHSSGSDDDESIGSAFDKWVRKSAASLELGRPSRAREFILRDMDYLASRYRELLLATRTLTPSLEPVYYNAFNSVTLQLPLILATLCTDDDDVTFQRKAKLVAGYLDIFVARSMVNAHDFRYATVEHRLFALAREIRGLDVETLAKRLGEEVAAIPENFDAVSSFALRPRNRMYVKYLLARIAAWLDAQCMTGLTFAHYIRSGKDQQPYEIEHIWADKLAYQPNIPRRRFADLRNRLGALLLLPKDFNASFGDMPYGKKLPKYMGQNLLARSLHPDCYQNNPAFLRMVEEYQLPFQPFPDGFDPPAIESRQELYRRLCEILWDPARYGLVMPAELPRQRVRARTRFDVSLRRLVDQGHLTPGTRLIGSYRGTDHKAELTEQARIRIESGEEFEAASPAALAVLETQSSNGWKFWHVVQPDGSLMRLDDVRRLAMQQEHPSEDDPA